MLGDGPNGCLLIGRAHTYTGAACGRRRQATDQIIGPSPVPTEARRDQP